MAQANVVSANTHECKKAVARIDASTLEKTGVHTVNCDADRYR
jgi:hypothetical protein